MSTSVPDDAPRVSEVCAVVVTYYPDVLMLGRLLSALKQQVGLVVLVDNGSSPELVSVLRGFVVDEGLLLHAFGNNRGLGVAHNQGIRIAGERGFDYVLLLDQDSEPAPDMVAELTRAHRRLSANHRVAAVGPRFVDPDSGHWSKFIRFGRIRFRGVECSPTQETVVADFLISSGSLISLAALEAVGYMDESLFIDHVDTEWCLRAGRSRWAFYGVCKAEMFHRLGDKGLHIPGLRSRRIAIHSPLRHYYMYRNSVNLMFRKYVPWQWRINDLFRILGMVLVFLLFAPNRWARFCSITQGIWHGLTGVTGQRPPID